LGVVCPFFDQRSRAHQFLDLPEFIVVSTAMIVKTHRSFVTFGVCMNTNTSLVQNSALDFGYKLIIPSIMIKYLRKAL
jgi:hypothetical protein